LTGSWPALGVLAWLPLLGALSLLPAGLQEPAAAERVYVDGRRSFDLRFSGRPYEPGRAFIEGGGVGNGAYAPDALLAGDFEVRMRLTLERRDATAAAFQLGQSYFGFDGGGRSLYLNGPLFGGSVTILGSADPYLSDGRPFDFVARREGEMLRFSIDGELAYERRVGEDEIGRFGLLPHRATMRIHRFSASGAVGQPTPRAPNEVRRMQPAIDEAIDRGVEFLLSTQHRDGSWSDNAGKFFGGMTALSTYTLLKCGLPQDHPAVRQALLYLERVEPHETYTTSFLVLALAATGEAAHRERMEELVAALADWERGGTWGYPFGYSGGWQTWVGRSDLSNTQIAALALRAARSAGIRIHPKVWHRLIDGTLDYRCPEEETTAPADVGTTHRTAIAGFGYKGPSSPYGSMTAAGVANLAIAREALGSDLGGAPARKVDRAIRAGVAWLAHNFTVTANPGRTHWLYYYLYGLERVGALLETERIGEHAWYLEGAEAILKRQASDGSWKERVQEPDTCFALLFLKRATALAPTSGTRGPQKPDLHVAEDPSFEVSMRGTGANPLIVWITGFGDEIREELGAGRLGPRVVRVDYLVDGRIAASVEGSPRKGWDGERYPARIELERRGTFEILSRVHVLPPEAELDQPEDVVALEARGFEVAVESAREAWMDAAAKLRSANLLLGRGATASASSTWGSGWAAGNAIDGLESTAWLCAAEDAAPRLAIELRSGVRADAVVLGAAGSSHLRARELDRIRRVELVLDGDAPIEVELDSDPRRPAIVELGKRRRVRRLEIAILEAEPGAKYPGSRGLSEVALIHTR